MRLVSQQQWFYYLFLVKTYNINDSIIVSYLYLIHQWSLLNIRFCLIFQFATFRLYKKKYLFNLMGFLSFRPVCVLLSFVLYCNFRYFFFFLLFRSFRQVFFVSSNVITIYKSIFILSFVNILLLITQHHWFYLGLFQCYFMYYSI